MSEKDQTRLEQAVQDGKYIRTIRSFVKREGRLTNGQAKAIDDKWPTMGLMHENGLINFSDVFANNNAVVLEIGFGMGKSLVEMASQNKDQNFIGIEVHRPGVGACLADAGEANIDNLRIYEHDAIEVLADCIADNSLDKVQLFFPDPWHKKRHHKRRIVQQQFVENLRTKLKVGGVFHMATDWENYAEHMLEVMKMSDKFENLSDSQDYVPRPEFRPLTKFEQRGHRLGHGVWDLMFKRIA